MRATTFPEAIQFRATEGTMEQLYGAASAAGQTASESLRAAVRDRLAETEADNNGASGD